MRNSRYILPVLALMALAACKNETEEKVLKPGDTAEVHFTAGIPATRTAFQEPNAAGYYPVRWTSGDKIALSQNGTGKLSATAEALNGGVSANFSATITVSETNRFYAIYPYEAVADLNTSKGAWLINVPWFQTPVEGSADPKAIILISSSDEYTTLPNPVQLTFSHFTAYIRLTLENLSGSLGAVKSIDLACSEPFAGNWYCSLSDGRLEARDASRSVHLATSSVVDQWVACAPVDMSGKTFTVTVNCASGSVRKSVTFPSDRQYAPGMVSTLTVDMTGAQAVSPAEGSEAFLASYEPGFFPVSGSSVVYSAGDQLSREYNGGKVTFSIISPAEESFVAFSGIPEAAVVGDSFTIGYSSVSTLGSSSGGYTVTVVKEDGSLLWLVSTAGDRFIVKK